MADLLWFRLKQGKVWHVACGGATVALCEEPLPIRGERQPKRPPFGARPCPSCSVASAQIELAMSDAARAVAEQRAKAVPVEPVAPEPYEHDLTEGRVEAVSLDPTNENPFPGAGEVIVEYGVFGETTPAEYEPDDPQGDDELREQIHEELGKLVAEGVVEFVAGGRGRVTEREYPNILGFLDARIAADEADVAKRRRWFGKGDPNSTGALQIDRAEAECVAKRRIVAAHDGDHECSGPGPCETLLALAGIYGAHPAFNPAWTLQ